MNARQPKMQHCFYCGEDLGVYVMPFGERDTCGKRECNREARDDALAQRDEAHEQLDRDVGWGQW